MAAVWRSARRSLRTLRVQVSVALLVAAAACAFVAGELSGAELTGAYREGAQDVLRTAADGYAQHAQGVPDTVAVNQLVDAHPFIVSARLIGASGRPTVASIRDASGERVVFRRAVEGGRTLELAYDLGPREAAVAARNRTIFLALAALLLAFTAFTWTLLGRGIFRPLNRLRRATHELASGELETRLRWKRRDELGALSRDFDAMAAKLEEGRRRLTDLALRDPLTGLANHRAFQESLARELRRARRRNRPLALAVVDIDHFKRFNDTRGHPFGDQVLAAAGRTLQAVVGDRGMPARLGGDEFGIVMPGMSDEEATALCHAIRRALPAAHPSELELTCSAGVACFPRDAAEATSLIQAADGALYWAKDAGRDRVKAYDPERVVVITDEQRGEFAELLARPATLEAAFQPVVDLLDGSLVGFEALARFAERRLPPAWWFAQAHRFGLGPQLEAAAILRALEAGPRPDGSFVALNVSPSALTSADVQAVLPEDLTGVVLEITEQEQVTDDGALLAALAPLRARGARVAVDDAGAGYAGLQQIMRLQADIIKLDRALVADVHRDSAKSALVGALAGFAAQTGAIVCAEGIEDLAVVPALLRLGVRYGQGYALARPAPPWAEVEPAARMACRGRTELAAAD